MVEVVFIACRTPSSFIENTISVYCKPVRTVNAHDWRSLCVLSGNLREQLIRFNTHLRQYSSSNFDNTK